MEIEEEERKGEEREGKERKGREGLISMVGCRGEERRGEERRGDRRYMDIYDNILRHCNLLHLSISRIGKKNMIYRIHDSSIRTPSL